MHIMPDAKLHIDAMLTMGFTCIPHPSLQPHKLPHLPLRLQVLVTAEVAKRGTQVILITPKNTHDCLGGNKQTTTYPLASSALIPSSPGKTDGPCSHCAKQKACCASLCVPPPYCVKGYGR